MLLSICIPTKNRIASLKKSVDSIIEQSYFRDTDLVELVVSDNCSSDGTRQYLASLVKLYPEKIRVLHQATDVGDYNFEKVLRAGVGDFRKLVNDSVVWTPGSLETMAMCVQAASSEKPMLFFANGHARARDAITLTKTPDEFLAAVSFHSTWIGSFGIWASELERFPAKSWSTVTAVGEPALIQVEMVIELLRAASHCIVVNIPFGQVHLASRKGEYSVAKVFGDVYLRVLQESGLFSESTFAEEKRRVFRDHILPIYFDGNLDFYKHPLEDDLPLYQDEPYFSVMIAEHRKKFFSNFGDNWRAMNPHNDTHAQSCFDPRCVSVGRYSYGPLRVSSWGALGERLSIGSYVSIANDVTFCLGGNHPYTGLSTYPFKVKFFAHAVEAKTKGPIVICDDVWIGMRAIIMSGVTIGQGAVIGAGAVVAKDIPPYAIAIGNPARVVRFRFSKAIIAKLLTVDFSKLDRDQCRAIGLEVLYEELSENNVDELISKLPRTEPD